LLAYIAYTVGKKIKKQIKVDCLVIELIECVKKKIKIAKNYKPPYEKKERKKVIYQHRNYF
jgi:hypothetical protein